MHLNGKAANFWIVTHVLTIALGWTVISVGGHRGKRGSKEDSTLTTDRQTKASRQRDQLDRSKPSGKLIWNLLQQIDEPETTDPLPPAKDRAAAARTAIDAWVKDGKDLKVLAEARIRFGHWLESDAKAALMYWNGSGSSGIPALAMLAEVAKPYLEAMNLRELATWFKNPQGLLDGAARDVMFGVFAAMIAHEQGLAVLEEVIAEMPPQGSSRLVLQLIQIWPPDKLDPLEAFIRKHPTAPALKAFVGLMKGPDSIQWVQRELLDGGSLSQLLRDSGLISSIIYRARGASVELRLKMLGESSVGSNSLAAPSMKAASLVVADISSWLTESDRLADGTMADWRHRLRHGEITPLQVMDEAQRAMPALAAEQPEEFRKTLFRTLSAIQPTSAVELISDLPLQQRETTLLDAAQGVAGQADPQHLIELLTQMPPTQLSKPNDRYQVWIRAAAPSYNKYGESYVAWVTAMPHGIERDWALSGLYANFIAYDPEKAEAIRSLKTMPPGWKPAQ